MIINESGGGAGLNLKVVGGTTQPTSPKENMIWVNTDTVITDWIFSAIQPTTKSDGTPLSGGEVWFNIGASSSIHFNALKKNGLWVYPNGCAQYVGGTWEKKYAQSYLNGTWVDWTTYLYNKGDKCISVTGGWIASAIRMNSGTDAVTPTIAFNSSEMVCHLPTASGLWDCGVVWTQNEIDLAPYKILKATGYVEAGSGFEKIIVAPASISMWESVPAQIALPWTSSGIVKLDVSALTGKYRVGCGILSSDSSQSIVHISKMELSMEAT